MAGNSRLDSQTGGPREDRAGRPLEAGGTKRPSFLRGPGKAPTLGALYPEPAGSS